MLLSPHTRRSCITVIVGLLVLTSAISAQGRSPEQQLSRRPSANEDGVRASMMGFMAALNALDADAMSRYFADDISAFVPTAQTDRAQGKAAVDRIFKAFVDRTKPTTARINLVPEAMEIDATPLLAVVSFQIHEPATVRRRTFVWRNVNGRWLISHFHASDVAVAKP